MWPSKTREGRKYPVLRTVHTSVHPSVQCGLSYQARGLRQSNQVQCVIGAARRRPPSEYPNLREIASIATRRKPRGTQRRCVEGGVMSCTPYSVPSHGICFFGSEPFSMTKRSPPRGQTGRRPLLPPWPWSLSPWIVSSLSASRLDAPFCVHVDQWPFAMTAHCLIIPASSSLDSLLRSGYIGSAGRLIHDTHSMPPRHAITSHPRGGRIAASP